jgi:hypothetical protein
MEMHKIQVKKVTCKAQAQRVLREHAQAQRVSDEQQTSTQTTLTSFSAIEVEASYNQTPVRIGGPLITTQEEVCPPAMNTHQQRQIQELTQNYMFCMMEVPVYTAPFTAAKAASCKYPLQFL